MANTLVLLSDEHNPFVSQPYGHNLVSTPNMARLAAKGTLYESAYCASPLCLPSRTALMTGRWPHENKAFSNANLGMPEEAETYAEALGREGVYTVHFGKTDVHRSADELGFDEIYHPKDREKPGDTYQSRRPLAIRTDAHERANDYGPDAHAFDEDDQTVNAALSWLRDKAPRLSQPWVAVVNTLKPHFPHWVTPDLWDKYAEGADLPPYGIEATSARHPYAEDLQKHFQTDQFTEEQIRGLRRGYLGCVDYVDQQLGKLMEAVQSAGMGPDTNIIYASDHGDMLGKFGLWWKCSLYEDSVRVPLIAAGPDFAAGKRVRTPVSLLDVPATFFRNAGVSMPASRLGTPLQDTPVWDPAKAVYSEYHGHGTRSGAFLIRRGDWKAIFNMEAEDQLFHLASDPDELENRAASEPELMESLRRELRRHVDPEAVNQEAHAFQDWQLAAPAAKP